MNKIKYRHFKRGIDDVFRFQILFLPFFINQTGDSGSTIDITKNATEGAQHSKMRMLSEKLAAITKEKTHPIFITK